MKIEPLLQIQENYVDKILESYEKMFGEIPKKSRASLAAVDHAENDISDFKQLL